MNGFTPQERQVFLTAIQAAIRSIEPVEARLPFSWPWHCAKTALVHLRQLAKALDGKQEAT